MKFRHTLLPLLVSGAMSGCATPDRAAVEGGALGGASSCYILAIMPPLALACVPIGALAGAGFGAVASSTVNTVRRERAAQRSAPSASDSGKGPSYFPAGIVEQEPILENHGCAPFNARAGSTYTHEDGRRVAVARILGESSNCPGARPLAVKLSYNK